MLLEYFWASGVLFILFRLYGDTRPSNPPASHAKLVFAYLWSKCLTRKT